MNRSESIPTSATMNCTRWAIRHESDIAREAIELGDDHPTLLHSGSGECGSQLRRSISPAPLPVDLGGTPLWRCLALGEAADGGTLCFKAVSGPTLPLVETL